MKYWLNELDLQSESFRREYQKASGSIRKEVPPFIIQIKTAGKVMVFSPLTYCILLSGNIRVINTETDKEEELNGIVAFLPHFLKGYAEGVAEFEGQYLMNSGALFGSERNKIVAMFHELVYHTKLKHPFRRGWRFVAENSPALITESELSFFGYYSAMLAGLEEIDAKYPNALKGIDICERKKENHKIEPKSAFKIIDIKLFQPVQDLFLKAGVSEQHLFDAIEGKPIEDRIEWLQNQNQLADLFRRLIKNSVIHGSFSEIAKWLNTYFEVDVKGKRQPVNQTTCFDVLREHKGKIPRHKRLLLKEHPESLQ